MVHCCLQLILALKGFSYQREQLSGELFSAWQADGVQAVGDLGGSILTGIDGNPLAVLCKQLRIPHHHINSQDVKLYMSNGKESDPELDAQVG